MFPLSGQFNQGLMSLSSLFAILNTVIINPFEEEVKQIPCYIYTERLIMLLRALAQIRRTDGAIHA